MRQYNNGTIKRVSKAAAFKAYASGELVTIAAANIDPANIYGVAVSNLSLPRALGTYTIDELPPRLDTVKNLFADHVASFEYYNCNSETGKYTAFYLKA